MWGEECSSVCSRSVGHVALSKAKGRWRCERFSSAHVGMSLEDPAFESCFALSAIWFEHLKMKDVVDSQNILPMSEPGVGDLKGACSGQN